MKRGILVLLGITGFLLFLAVVMAIWQVRHRGLRGAGEWSSPEYLAKLNQIRSIQRIKGTRPFTPKEMDLLRKFIRDPDLFIRVRAVTAFFWDPKDPQQRKEAIQLLRERLKDPEWLVRSYALHALARLGAKETVPDILPLLNDPHPDVRNWAQKALKQLGYQVRE